MDLVVVFDANDRSGSPSHEEAFPPRAVTRSIAISRASSSAAVAAIEPRVAVHVGLGEEWPEKHDAARGRMRVLGPSCLVAPQDRPSTLISKYSF